jgi:hypothetical protein
VWILDGMYASQFDGLYAFHHFIKVLVAALRKHTAVGWT